MRIVVGSDHVGFPLKQAVVEHLASAGLDVTDVGTYASDEAVDYPEYARRVCLRVAEGESERGVLICGTGLGMSMAANRFPGVRAALCHDVFTAHMSRAHNDANILCLGAWVVTPQRMTGILDEWLRTEFEGGRHTPRLAELALFPGESVANACRMAEKLGKLQVRFGVALSPRQSVFGPLLFAGRLADGFQAVAKCGFQTVEVSLRSPDDISAHALRSLLRQHGLSLAAIATGQACLHDSLCLADRDPDVRQAAIARLKSLIEMAADFHACVIVGGIRGRLSGPQEEQEHTRVAVRQALWECADFAARRDVTLLLEPINRYETNFINTAAEALQLLDEIGHPGIRLLLDTFHMNIEEVDLASGLRAAGRLLAALHIADSNRKAPGLGHIDFTSVFGTLVEIGFEGPITAEILPVPDDLEALVQTAEFLGLGVRNGERGAAAIH